MFRPLARLRRTILAMIITLGWSICGGCASADTASLGNGTEKGDETVAQVMPHRSGGYFPYLVYQFLLDEGDLDDARDALEDAIAMDSDSGFLKREMALLLIQQSRNDEALEVVEERLRSYPEDVDALIIYGRITQGMKRLELAKQAYSHVLELDPDRKNIYLLLGSILMEADDHEAAKEVYARLVARFPNNFPGHYYLGKIQADQGLDDEAQKSFLKALEIKPGLEQPRFELIELYHKTGRHDLAGEQYARLLENNPKSIRAALGYGIYLHKEGRMAEASEILKELGVRSEEDNAVFRFLIRHYLEKKLFEDAAVALSGMLTGAQNPSDIRYLLGVALEGEKKIEAAIDQYVKIRPGERFYPDAAIHLAYIYQEQDRIEEGIEFLSEVIQHLPDNAEFRLYLGTFYEEAKEYEKAEAALKAGLSVDPKNPKVYFRLGVVYDKWGRKDQSIEAMKEVIRLDPKHANALNYLGYTYADLGRNLDEAENLISRALALMPYDGYITDSLGWVYFKRGKFDKALEYLKKAVDMVPDDPVILEHLGDVYRQTGNPDKALDIYRRSLENKKEDRSGLEEKIRGLTGDAQ